MNKLLTFINLADTLTAHGVKSEIKVGPNGLELWALSVWTRNDGTSGSDWERVQATRSAVRKWLGY